MFPINKNEKYYYEFSFKIEYILLLYYIFKKQKKNIDFFINNLIEQKFSLHSLVFSIIFRCISYLKSFSSFIQEIIKQNGYLKTRLIIKLSINR